jgi:hypothetical protein
MDVPEPSTVIFNGAWDMLRKLKLFRTLCRTCSYKNSRLLRPHLGFWQCRCRLSGNRLVDL